MPKRTKAEQDQINLRPGTNLTPEDGRRGGKKSGESKRLKKSMAEMAKIINESALKDGEVSKFKAEFTALGDDPNKQFALMAKLYKTAMTGNVKAMKLWIETSDFRNEAKKDLENELLRAEIEKLQAELDAMKKEAESLDTSGVTVNIEFKDCKNGNNGTD